MDVVTYIVQGFLAFLFLIAGFGKVTASPMHVEGFNHWGFPQWFRVVTGIVELVGAILLIVGYWSTAAVLTGSLLLAITGIGGIITHIRVKDSLKDTAMITFLAILSFAIFFHYIFNA